MDTGGNNFRPSLPWKSCLGLAASPDDARCERSLAGSEGDDVRGWGPRSGMGERRAPGGAPRGRLHSHDARVRLVSHDRSQHRAAAAQPRAGRHAQAGRHRRLVRPFPDRSCCARALNETDFWDRPAITGASEEGDRTEVLLNLLPTAPSGSNIGTVVPGQGAIRVVRAPSAVARPCTCILCAEYPR